MHVVPSNFPLNAWVKEFGIVLPFILRSLDMYKQQTTVNKKKKEQGEVSVRVEASLRVSEYHLKFAVR